MDREKFKEIRDNYFIKEVYKGLRDLATHLHVEGGKLWVGYIPKDKDLSIEFLAIALVEQNGTSNTYKVTANFPWFKSNTRTGVVDPVLVNCKDLIDQLHIFTLEAEFNSDPTSFYISEEYIKELVNRKTPVVTISPEILKDALIVLQNKDLQEALYDEVMVNVDMWDFDGVKESIGKCLKRLLSPDTAKLVMQSLGN